MGVEAALFASAVGSVAAARQASAMGKYNQAVQNRNAKVLEQDAEAIEQKKEFDIAKEYNQALSFVESFFKIIESDASFKSKILMKARTK